MQRRIITALILLTTLAFSQGSTHLGLRTAAGVSALRSHIGLPIQGSPDAEGIRLNPAFSASAGITFAYDINSLISIAPELQYTLYRANGRFIKENETAFADRNEAGVTLHTIELPILFRFSFSKFYAEAGPQVGANLDATAYINSQLKSPDEKLLAFGPTIGFGLKMDTFLIGARGHFGIFEYAENTNGYPWTAQISITKFFF